MPAAKCCLERGDFEKLVRDNFQSLEECQSILAKSNARPAVDAEPERMAILKSRIQTVLAQDRGVQNFEQYTTGKDHRERMKLLSQHAPELYDNPEVTPRSEWFQHPRYRQNSQMPPFHVHFRQEMQETLRYLYQAYASCCSDSDSSSTRKYLQRAAATFRGSMRGLQGHVRIEEYACFPLYEDLFPNVDIAFLYADHKELYRAEEKVEGSLDALSRQEHPASTEQTVDAMELFLTFDDQLMVHLGEEEEVVVPMSLTDKDVFF